MIRAIIIEDEAKARSALKQEIDFNCSTIEVVGEAGSVEQGVRLIEKLSPELIFLDIQLSDGTAFSLLEQAKEHEFKIIFTTAYSEHALKAFKYDTIDYLLKPVDGDELKQAVNKVLKTSKSDWGKKMDLLLQSQQVDGNKNRIVLQTSDGLRVYDVSTIIRCESNGNYTYFHFAQGKKLLVSKTMKSFEKRLFPSGFVRIHHSHIINLYHLLSYNSVGDKHVVMSDSSKLPVAQRRRSHFMEVLEKFNKEC